jgi:hypothetical protein
VLPCPALRQPAVFVVSEQRGREIWRREEKRSRQEKGQIRATSNSLGNQLRIHLILAKQEKLTYNSLAKQLDKNRNLAKLTSPRVYMRADHGCHRRFSVGVWVKKEIKNRERFLM